MCLFYVNSIILCPSITKFLLKEQVMGGMDTPTLLEPWSLWLANWGDLTCASHSFSQRLWPIFLLSITSFVFAFSTHRIILKWVNFISVGFSKTLFFLGILPRNQLKERLVNPSMRAFKTTRFWNSNPITLVLAKLWILSDQRVVTNPL
jgi:hypothetical protein